MSEVMERTAVSMKHGTVLDKPEENRTWYPTSAEEVAAARAQFADLTHPSKGYFAYREEEGGGGTVIREFDPESDVTYMPRMVGG